MISEGAKVSFIPAWDISKADDAAERKKKVVVGTVASVNWQNRTFCVEYECGNSIQREAFQFFDIGKSVRFCG